MTLTEFLLARIAEVRETVRYASEVFVRELADCDAKKRLVDLHHHMRQDGQRELVCIECSDDYRGPKYRGPCQTLRLLALPYRDHPDYDPIWRP